MAPGRLNSKMATFTMEIGLTVKNLGEGITDMQMEILTKDN